MGLRQDTVSLTFISGEQREGAAMYLFKKGKGVNGLVRIEN